MVVKQYKDCFVPHLSKKIRQVQKASKIRKPSVSNDAYHHGSYVTKKTTKIEEMTKALKYFKFKNYVKLSSKGSSDALVYYRKRLLELFDMLYEWYSEGENGPGSRIDTKVWNYFNEKELLLKETHNTIGPIAGVEVGDEFDLRFHLVIMGIHPHHMNGIGYTQKRVGKRELATVIVATEGECDDYLRENEIIYEGEGGNFRRNDECPKDQMLKRGNLALLNSMVARNYVRFVRGINNKKGKKKGSTTFVYDGLYKVERCYPRKGPFGNKVWKFKLVRCFGQKSIDWKRLKIVGFFEGKIKLMGKDVGKMKWIINCKGV